ncbi:MAG: DMT family transporter [Candidatus Kapaibacterium sp.]
MQLRTKGIVYLIIGAFIWSFGGLFIKLISMAPLAIAGWRSFFAAIIMLFFVRKEKLAISKWSLIGALSYSGTVILFVIATKLTTAANAILIQYTAPIYVGLLSRRILNENIKKKDWIIIIVAILGMTLFFAENIFSSKTQTNNYNLIGNVTAIFSGVCFAFTVISIRREKMNSTLQPVLYGNIITAIIALPLSGFEIPSSNNLIYLLFLGFIQLGFGYLFFAKGTKLVTAIESALVPIIEPVLNPIWVALFYLEYPSFIAVIGGLIVILAITSKSINFEGIKKLIS